MKFLKYLFLLIILLVALFFLKGLMTPSISYDSEIIVNKSAEESWAVMSDISRMPEWMEGFKKSVLVSGTENTPGAVSNIYVEENGQEMVIEETINKISPPQLLDMTFRMDFMNMEYVMQLEENAEGTKITTKSVTTGNGIVSKSIISFMTGVMKGQEDENMSRLKKLIDSNTQNYFKAEESEATVPIEQ